MSIILIKKVIRESIFQSIKSCDYDLNIDEKDIKLDETKNKDIVLKVIYRPSGY